MAVKVRAARQDDLVDGAALLNNALGLRTSSRALGQVKGYLTGEVFVLPYSPSGLEMLSGSYPDVAGIAVIGHGHPGQFNGILPAEARPHLPERFAHLHYLALDPRVRAQGLSSPLIAAAVRWALAHQYRYLVAASWYSGKSRSSGDLLNAAGAKAVGVAPMRLLQPSRDCPACPPGDPHNCHCTAVVYVRQIDQDELKTWTSARRQGRR